MKLTDAEWQIMNALWASHPATARQIATRLPAGVSWAYTTVKTLLARLVDKGALSESKQGNTSVYEPLLSRTGARRSALKVLANQAFDGALGPLLHFLVEEEEGLSQRQRAQLAALLKRHEKHEQGTQTKQ